jgi:pyruvate-ferredoxin/flavodoxin oxidoreductase
LLTSLADAVGSELAKSILETSQEDEPAVFAQRERVERLDKELERLVASGDSALSVQARHLQALSGVLVRKCVWIVGGDGWAYDIGFGGLDHVLSSGRDINILVLDTEVYSNTGGQASKATQRGALAKFAASGKESPKKDLGAVARSYGNVYVAQIAIGANDLQATKALLEAEAWPGPSLVIAYSTCIAHGIDMATSMTHQKDAVKSGYWPLYRFHPSRAEKGQPFQLDSKAPTMPLSEFTDSEARYATLARTFPQQAARLDALAQADVTERWRFYEQLASVQRTVPQVAPEGDPEVGSGTEHDHDKEV